MSKSITTIEEVDIGVWKDKEDGPDCLCGQKTTVFGIKQEDGTFVPALFCLWHDTDVGQLVFLPRDKRPNCVLSHMLMQDFLKWHMQNFK